MSRTGRSVGHRAFTLIDCLISVGAVALLVAIAVTGLDRARRSASIAACTARLGALGQGNAAFALSNNNLMAGLTWQIGGNNSQYPDLNAQQNTSATNAHAAQAVDILRRRGRPDIPVISNWVPDIGYWSLALVDFQDRPLSDAFNLCPSHDNLNKWRRWPQAFDQGVFGVAQPSPSALNKRWPYSSSYTLTGAAFDVNQSILTPVAASARISTSTSHNLYSLPGNANVGPSLMSLVAFPSQKVHVFDSHQRHFPGRHLYYAYADAQQPILFFDGSVSVRRSGDSRTPWAPNQPTSTFPLTFQYQPAAWEPPTQSGQASQSVVDRYRWTRDGLLGWDFTN